jgi:hypothetical protein
VREGEHARTLYQNNGFIDLENVGKNPTGIETVMMVKRKTDSISQSLSFT